MNDGIKHDTPDPHDGPGTMSLAEALRLAADHAPAQLPPPAVAAAAQAALRQRMALEAARAAQATGTAATPSSRGTLSRLWAWSGAAAVFASVAIASVLLLVLAGAPAPSFAPQQAAFEASDFVPLLPPERWPADTASGASPAFLVRTELPGQRLAALGLPFDPAHAGDRRPAELLVHPSGEVLAVRLVR